MIIYRHMPGKGEVIQWNRKWSPCWASLTKLSISRNFRSIPHSEQCNIAFVYVTHYVSPCRNQAVVIYAVKHNHYVLLFITIYICMKIMKSDKITSRGFGSILDSPISIFFITDTSRRGPLRAILHPSPSLIPRRSAFFLWPEVRDWGGRRYIVVEWSRKFLLNSDTRN